MYAFSVLISNIDMGKIVKKERSYNKVPLTLTIFWSEIVSVIQRGALKTNCT